ncbi:SDR family oxidoreductase [Thermomonospora umbrina]|uniref:NmrA-like family protein n=1 Tax=Thermomonospora umbrina TaxID=111806 RepID=A0A3D9SX74_9ACTN|nr:NmrA family NAD(P)-binding protein [Thermomonospora umbrina]REF00449.1 NmrA-like family protein [Thermomonospora umbrina]
MKALIVGASGYNGRNVAWHVSREGHAVRGLVRDLQRAPADLDEVVRGDLTTGDGLEQALDGVDVAFYFVHSLDAGVGSTDDRDIRAATQFVRAARTTGLPRGVFFTTLAPPPAPRPRLPAQPARRRTNSDGGNPRRDRAARGRGHRSGISGHTALPAAGATRPTPALGPWRRNRVALLDHVAMPDRRRHSRRTGRTITGRCRIPRRLHARHCQVPGPTTSHRSPPPAVQQPTRRGTDGGDHRRVLRRRLRTHHTLHRVHPLPMLQALREAVTATPGAAFARAL